MTTLVDALIVLIGSALVLALGACLDEWYLKPRRDREDWIDEGNVR